MQLKNIHGKGTYEDLKIKSKKFYKLTEIKLKEISDEYRIKYNELKKIKGGPMEKENKIALYNFILCQTVANENFSYSLDYIKDKFKIILDTKYKNRFNANRQTKKKLESQMNEELRAFKKAKERYLKATNSMLKHFDAWRESDSLDEDVNKLYDQLVLINKK